MVALYGLIGGVLIVVLKLTEYRFLVIEHSLEIYGGMVAALFSGLGIWLGLTLTRRRVEANSKVAELSASPHQTRPLPGNTGAGGPVVPGFAADAIRLAELGLTPRELEILGLIAAGLSNREIAQRLFVSENTVKTHSSRLFDKLGAKRRTQAVLLAKQARLIP